MKFLSQGQPIYEIGIAATDVDVERLNERDHLPVIGAAFEKLYGAPLRRRAARVWGQRSFARMVAAVLPLDGTFTIQPGEKPKLPKPKFNDATAAAVQVLQWQVAGLEESAVRQRVWGLLQANKFPDLFDVLTNPEIESGYRERRETADMAHRVANKRRDRERESIEGSYQEHRDYDRYRSEMTAHDAQRETDRAAYELAVDDADATRDAQFALQDAASKLQEFRRAALVYACCGTTDFQNVSPDDLRALAYILSGVEIPRKLFRVDVA